MAGIFGKADFGLGSGAGRHCGTAMDFLRQGTSPLPALVSPNEEGREKKCVPHAGYECNPHISTVSSSPIWKKKKDRLPACVPIHVKMNPN